MQSDHISGKNFRNYDHFKQVDDSVDFKRYLSLFISNWYWFAISLFFAISIAYGINRWSEEVYSVSSTLLINDDQYAAGTAGLSNIFPGSNAFESVQKLNNEIGILSSFSVNYRVMNELSYFHVVYVAVGKRGIAETRLYKSNPFIVVYDSLEKQKTGLKVSVKILSDSNYNLEIDGDINFSQILSFGDRFNEMGFDFRIEKNPNSFSFDAGSSNRYYFYFVSPVMLANQYRNKLNISPIGEDATLVTLALSGSVPNQEADYLNKLMEVYLLQGLEVKNQKAEKTIEFIDQQIGTISDSLRNVENSLENFRLSNKIIDLSQEGSFIQNRLEMYDRERNSLLLEKKYYKYLTQYISSKGETADIVSPGAMGVNNSSLERLVSELAAFQQQKSRLDLNIADELPAITLIDNNIKDIKARIAENIKSSISTVDNALEDSDRRISLVESELKKIPGTERRLINIQRKFDLNNTVYNFLLEKKAEAGIAKASNVSDNRIIDYAEPFNSSRISPKPRQNYMLAIILGLMIPVLVIFLIDYLNNKIIDKKDIEKGTSAPVIGFVGHNALKSELPVVKNLGSTLSESFRSVRTNLKYFLKENPCPVVSVSSTISAEGKTFISVNLSAIMAMTDKKVLLIGLDLRKPRIHKIFGLSNGIGISNYLIGEKKFDDVVVKTEIEKLWYVPSGPIPPNPAELIESAAMDEFIQKAKGIFDFIIIDTPPVAVVTDALLVSHFTDLYLFVVRQRYTSKNTLELVNELIKNENIKNLGIVFNDISMSGYYGYGLRYGYAMGYGYNYGYNYYSQYGKYGYSDAAKSYYTENDD